MKNRLLILVIILLVGFNHSFAGGDFEGIIVYNISYGGQDVDPQMAAMMPKTAKFKIKEQKSLMEMNMAMGSTKVIFNGESGNGVTLMDMMGQKFALTMSAEDIEKEVENAPDVSVDITGETKEIAGYLCKKAVVKFKGEGSNKEVEVTVFFTEELGSGIHNFSNPMYKDIDGVMMEYTMKEDKMDLTFTAISVDKKKISDSEFEIPEGYQTMDQADFESMFGGH